MPLPKIDQPLFELTMPSNNKKYKFRPFSVKEEKILLIAQESKEVEQTISAIKQVINNCVYDIDVEKMPLFDLEYAIINIRSKSVNNEIQFSIKDPETNEKVDLVLNLDEVKVSYDEKHSKKIQLSDTAVILLRYPTINELKKMMEKPNDPESLFSILVSCLDVLAIGEDEVYKFSEYSENEISEFVDNLSGDVLKKIKEFFETMPKLRHEMKYTNSKGEEKTFVLEGLDNFFI